MSPPPSSAPAALVVGASRGLGLGLVDSLAGRGWRVMGTVRGTGRTGLHERAEQSGGAVEVEKVDVADEAQIAALARRLRDRRFDLLFVNAGISANPADSIGEVSTDDFSKVMLTNALGCMRAVEALAPLVAPGGVIGVMSSGLGSVAENESGGWEVYRASKAALNTLMRSFAARHRGARWGMAIIAPGWVRTDMGGPQAPLSIEQSTAGVIDTLLARAGQSGVEFLDYQGRTVKW